MAKARKNANPTVGLGPLDWEVIEEFEDDAYENLDYDEYERQCKLIEEENNQFLDEFYDDLVEAGLKAKTVSKHIDNLHFYLNTYLVRTAPLHMRAGCYKVGDYLGNFFIRKCMWSTPTSIKGNAASFKKFYKSMLKRGRITQDDYDCLASTIKCDMEYWCEDCAQFNDPYGDNPFSPFPSGFGGVGGALGGGLGLGGGSALGSGSLIGALAELGEHGGFNDDGLPDFDALDDEGKALVRDIANELFESLLAQGLSEEELMESLEAVNGELAREMAIFDATDDEILATLAEIGLNTNREELEGLIRASAAEGDVFDALCKEAGVEFDEGDMDIDLACTAIGELWTRWMPDEPSFTTALDAIASGYCYEDGEWRDTLEDWAEAFKGLQRTVSLVGVGIANDSDEVVYGHSIPGWLCDYEAVLERAAEQDASYVDELAAFRSKIIQMHE